MPIRDSKPGKYNTPLTLEGTVIDVPKIKGWNVSIGSLWNCRTSEHLEDNIFITDRINSDKYLEVIPVTDMKYTLNRVGDSNGKAELLDISVYIKLELPGAITVEGGVDFTKENVKHFQQEEFFCQYNVQTCVERTRASVQDPYNQQEDEFINSATYEEIKNGEKATHYVSEIRYGGFATGNFRLNDKLSHDLLDLKGTVGGVVPVFAGINVGLKASVGFMEQDTSKHFDKEVSLVGTHIPIIKLDTITDMFDAIEQLPSLIDNPPPALRNANPAIKGSPISIKLTPLSFLLKMSEGYERYDLLDAEILKELTEMFLHLNDFKDTKGNPYRTLLCEHDARLAIIFESESVGLNCWAAKINEYEIGLVQMAGEFNDKATISFDKHKDGVKSAIDEIKSILNEYFLSALFPPTLKQTVLQHVIEGKDILSALRPADAVLAGQEKLFEFNSVVWEFLETGDDPESHRILLLTNGEPPIGCFIKLYSMTPSLIDLGFEVWVAAPNIAEKCATGVGPNIDEGFCLELKIGGAELEKYYGNDIMKMLKLFEVIISSKFRNHSNTSKFYTLHSYDNKTAEPGNWLNSEITDNFQRIQSDFQSKGIFCADSYLQTIEILTSVESNVEWTFILLTQFLGSAQDVYFYYNELVGRLRDSNVTFRTVVACLDTFGDVEDGPLLLVLDKNATIVAICFDRLDFLLLGHQMSKKAKFEFLSPEQMAVCPLNFKVETAAEINNLLSGEDTQISLRENPFQLEDDRSVLKEFIDAKSILQIAAFSPGKKLVAYVAKIVANLSVYRGSVIAILNNYNWKEEHGFLGVEEPNWGNLSSDLEGLKLEMTEDGVEVPKMFDVLISAVNYAASLKGTDLQNVCEAFVNIFFNKINITDDEKDPLEVAIDNELSGINSAEKTLTQVLKSLRLLEFAKCNTNFFLLWQRFDDMLVIIKADDQQSVTKVLQLVSEFTPEEQRWIWGNPKFQFWTSLFHQSNIILARTYEYFCLTSKSVPNWLPTEMRTHLLVVQETLENSNLKYLNTWSTVKQMTETFGMLIVKNSVPVDFTEILYRNLIGNPILKDELVKVDALFLWDKNEECFEAAWGMSEISFAFEALRSKNEIPAKSILNQHVSNQHFSNEALVKKVKDDAVFINVNTRWAPFTGGKIRLVLLDDFQELKSSFIEPPLIMLDDEKLLQTCEIVVSYVTEQLKQDNGSVLENRKMLQFIDYEHLPDDALGYNNLPHPDPKEIDNSWTFSSSLPFGMIFSPSLSCFGGSLSNKISTEKEDNEESVAFFISRSDILTLLLTSVDEAVKLELFYKLVQKSTNLYALPWFLPDITKEELETVNLTKFLQNLDLQDFYSSPGIDSRLLIAPYKLITAIRIGSAGNDIPIGKSTILNEALLDRGQFSFKFEPGFENGLPISREGLVELSFLTEFTAKPEFYANVLDEYFSTYDREMLLMANVHGDFMTLPKALVETLKLHTGAFLVFWNCKNWKEMLLLKPTLDKILLGSRRLFNLVLNPDNTIAKNVDQSMIIDTSTNYKPVVYSMMNDVINGISPLSNLAIDNGPAANFSSLVINNTIQSVRRSLTLQTQELNVHSEFDDLRTEVLKKFRDLISQPDSSIRNSELWKLYHQLQILTQKSTEPYVKDKLQLSSHHAKLQDDKEQQMVTEIALRAVRQQINYNSLTLTNLFRELNLQCLKDGFSTDVQKYYNTVVDLFFSGFPIEMVNLSFESNFDPSVKACFDKLNGCSLKFITISVLGPHLSYKTSLLNKLFYPGFEMGAGGSTNGIMMRLVHLSTTNKPASMKDIDSILLLDSEGFSRAENTLDGSAALKEKQLSAFILAMSDVCLVSCGGGLDAWLTNLSDILEMSILADCSLHKEPLFPDVIIVDHYDTLKSSGMDAIRTQQIKDMLMTVSNISSQNPVATGIKDSVVNRIKPLYARTLSGNLVLNIPTPIKNDNEYHKAIESLRENVIQSCGRVHLKANWVATVDEVWSTLDKEKDLFRNINSSRMEKSLMLKGVFSSVRECLEIIHSGHEDLLEDTNEDLDLTILNKIPYFCPILDDDDCYCKYQLEELEKLEEKIAIVAEPLMTKLELQDLAEYTKQLRADIVARIQQEEIGMQISQGIKDEQLDKKLQEMLESDSNPWTLFVQYVSTFLKVSSWEDVIEKEIEQEYGTELLHEVRMTKREEEDGLISYEQLDAFNLDHIGQWGQSPLDVSKRVKELKEKLGWEEFIWLEIEVETKIRNVSFAGNGYKRGMLRQLRDTVNQLLANTFKERLPSEFEFLPSFVSSVHSLAVASFLNYWKVEWENWKTMWNPVTLLKAKKNKFPHEIFVTPRD